jgi:hypothetical protein
VSAKDLNGHYSCQLTQVRLVVLPPLRDSAARPGPFLRKWTSRMGYRRSARTRIAAGFGQSAGAHSSFPGGRVRPGRFAQAVAALPAARTYAGLRAVFDRRSAIIRREIVSLTDLDPPGELRQELRGLVGAIQDELVAAEDLRVASLSGDIESAQGADYRGGKAERRASLHARQLGLAVCGRPFKTP